MATFITVLGGKGGNAKSTTSFLLGWYLTYCTDFEAQWVDLDGRTATLSKVYDNRKQEGYALPEMAFSALVDAPSEDAQEIADAFERFVQQRFNDNVVFIIDTPPDLTAPASRVAVSYSQILLLPAYLSLPVVYEINGLAELLVDAFREQIVRQERYVALLPVGKSTGAVISSNEMASEEILSRINPLVRRLEPIPRSETIPFCMMAGIYPTEWTSNRYRAEKATQLHQAIRNSFTPIVEIIENLKVTQS